MGKNTKIRKNLHKTVYFVFYEEEEDDFESVFLLLKHILYFY